MSTMTLESILEAKSCLEETYGFATTSPVAQQKINFALDVMDLMIAHLTSREAKGEICAFRWLFEGDYKSQWMDGKPDADMVAISHRNGRGIEYAYTHPAAQEAAKPVGTEERIKRAESEAYERGWNACRNATFSAP